MPYSSAAFSGGKMKKLWFVIAEYNGKAGSAALFPSEAEAIASASTCANDSPGIAHHIAVQTAVVLAAIHSAEVITISEA